MFSLFYDMLFFFVNSYDHPQADNTDGGVQKGIRKFSLITSYVSFFFRIPLAIVFWKDSLDFEKIVKGRRSGSPSSPRSPANAPNIFIREASPRDVAGGTRPHPRF